MECVDLRQTLECTGPPIPRNENERVLCGVVAWQRVDERVKLLSQGIRGDRRLLMLRLHHDQVARHELGVASRDLHFLHTTSHYRVRLHTLAIVFLLEIQPPHGLEAVRGSERPLR